MKRLLQLIVPFAILAACSSPSATNDTAAVPDTSAVAAAEPSATPTATPTPEEKPMSDYENKVAVLHTGEGDITIHFFPNKAPGHVRNFIDLAEQGFYNGTRFHRIVPGFMIQGGDPNTKTENRGSWGMGNSGKYLKAEFNDIHHARGIVSMARSNDPDSASSQFFICVADAGFLDRKYTAFGEVTKGMDVVDKIVSGKAQGELAANPVEIKSVTIEEMKDGGKGSSK